MKELSPESLAPKTPEAEVVAGLEKQLEVLLAKVAREEQRPEVAEDEAAEDVPHKRLTSCSSRSLMTALRRSCHPPHESQAAGTGQNCTSPGEGPAISGLT